MEPLLDIKDVHVSYMRDAGPVRVLNGATITIYPGQSLGIVGESGAGKTILVRTILNLLRSPWEVSRGSIMFEGEDLLKKDEEALRNIRGAKIALTSPEPRKQLNPLIRVGDQIANAVQAHSDMSRKAAMVRAAELLRAVRLPDPERCVRAYPHELSGGMCQRVVIAMALIHSPKLLLADEPTAGLDVTLSRQILDLMHELVEQFGSSLVLVSRDLGVVAHYCQRVAVMYAGQFIEIGDTLEMFRRAGHPYTRHLMRAASAARDDRRGIESTVGAHAQAAENGCAYAPRCTVSLPDCTRERPSLERVGPGHMARCLRRDEVSRGEVPA